MTNMIEHITQNGFSETFKCPYGTPSPTCKVLNITFLPDDSYFYVENGGWWGYITTNNQKQRIVYCGVDLKQPTTNYTNKIYLEKNKPYDAVISKVYMKKPDDISNNKQIQYETHHCFYVIEADRDGVRKYVSKTHPRPYLYTIKLHLAKRFTTEDSARDYIRSLPDRFKIKNPTIRPVKQCLSVDFSTHIDI